MDKLSKAKWECENAREPLILTGAGISVSSGIPSFRGSGGLWKNRDFLRFAQADIWQKDPRGAWDLFEQARLLALRAEPNAAHRAISSYHHLLQETLRKTYFFTQNVDGLHERAAHGKPTELHGSLHRIHCPACATCVPVKDTVPLTQDCPACGTLRRHDVVLFGERVREAQQLTDAVFGCDLLLIVGTSGLVTNTGKIAKICRGRKIPVIEVNPSWFTPATFWTTISLRAPAEEILPALVA